MKCFQCIWASSLISLTTVLKVALRNLILCNFMAPQTPQNGFSRTGHAPKVLDVFCVREEKRLWQACWEEPSL